MSATTPKTRGRKANKLPPVRMTDVEFNWALAEMDRLGLATFTDLVRVKVFKGMPGFKLIASHKAGF